MPVQEVGKWETYDRGPQAEYLGIRKNSSNILLQPKEGVGGSRRNGYRTRIARLSGSQCWKFQQMGLLGRSA